MYGELPEILTEDGEKIFGYPIQIQNPPKTCAVRLPTSEELMAWLGSQKSVSRTLGRGKSRSERVVNPKADRTLFKAIRLDRVNNEDQEFDDAEAAYAVNVIMYHEVTKCERQGQEYEVVISTVFGDTVHRVAIPFLRDMAEYRRGAYQETSLQHNATEVRVPPEAQVKLYDKIVRETSGYTNGTIPPHHKRSVIFEVVAALNELDPEVSPNS